MKQLLLLLLITFGVTACNPQMAISATEIAPPTKPEEPSQPPKPTAKMMRITINNVQFTATLEQNTASDAFVALLPLSITMNEMNDNEIYTSLPKPLPVAPYSPRTIQNGDIMIFGSSTLVVFYKTFSTSYSYTKIGRIDNPKQLQNACSNGRVEVKFENVEPK